MCEIDNLRTKFIMQMTGNEFLKLMEIGLSEIMEKKEKRYARGIKELADSLGCSPGQIYVFRRQLGGKISEAIVDRFGKKYIFDVDKFIALVKMLPA